MTPLLIPMPGNDPLVSALADRSGWETGRLETREFPDGETYLRIHANCTARSVAVVCTLNHPDGKALPLLFAMDALRECGASRVGLVAPYLAYMRQDRRFRAGEAITSRTFASVLSHHSDWLITVDPHLHRVHSLNELYAVPARALHAASALAAWISVEVEAPLLVGPDQESKQWVADVAKRASAPYVVLSKLRRGDRDVEVSIPDVERHRDRTPVILDDIISSARTMAQTTQRLVTAGLPSPVCLGVHGVFSEDAEAVLLEAGAARIVTTNTIPHPTNAIEIADLLVPSIRDLAG